jgi:hypothetical protein
MTTTIEKLRQVVIDEARKVAAVADVSGGSALVAYDSDLCLAVRALERHEARIAELEAKLDEQTHKRDCECAITHCYADVTK